MKMSSIGIVAVTLVLAACGQDQIPDAADPQSVGVDTTMSPESLLEDMAGVLGSLEAFSVHMEKTFDEVLADGAKVQYSGAADLSMRRPDRFHVDYGDDLSAKEAWYDGEHFTLLDHLRNVYAQVPAAPPIRNVLETLEQDYDLFLPLAALLRPDPSKEYGDGAYLKRYLGIHDVDGWACHHLLFRGDQVDWQLWIDTGDEPLLRKVVVTYKQVEGAPQHVTLLSDWQLDPSIDDAQFLADLPDDAVHAEVLNKNGDTP
jgi:hypothetical protein